MRVILFSVIIPTYNSADTVLETLQSIIKTGENNLEILIMDDGSTDKTVELIEYKRFPNVKILNCSHVGPANIKNFAVKQATGKFICFLDSDDLIDVSYFKILRESLALKPELLIFNYAVFDNDKSNVRSPRIVSPMIAKMGTMVWNKVYSADLIKNITFPEDTIFEDVGFSTQAYLLSKNTVYVDKILYYYRQRWGSITKDPNKPVNTHLDVIKGFDELFSFIKKNNFNLRKEEKKDISILINNNILMHIRKVLSLYDTQNKGVKKTINELLKFKKKANILLGKRYSLLFSDKNIENLKFQIMFFLVKIQAWKAIKLIVSRNKNNLK